MAQEYTVTLFVGDDQYLEPIAVQDGKIAQPDALAADKVPEGMAFKGWYTPVSYTHLDVYKRQPLRYATGRENGKPKPQKTRGE